MKTNIYFATLMPVDFWNGSLTLHDLMCSESSMDIPRCGDESFMDIKGKYTRIEYFIDACRDFLKNNNAELRKSEVFIQTETDYRLIPFINGQFFDFACAFKVEKGGNVFVFANSEHYVKYLQSEFGISYGDLYEDERFIYVDPEE